MLIERYLFEDIAIPLYHKCQIEPTIEGIVDFLEKDTVNFPLDTERANLRLLDTLKNFLQKDVAEQKKRKIKFFTERFLVNTICKEKAYINPFLEKNGLFHLRLIFPPTTKEYLLIYDMTNDRMC